MKAFDFNRFLNVARWDLSVNSKFYTRSALLMVAIICMPIVIYYLYNMLTNGFFFTTETYDNIYSFVSIDTILGFVYTIITSGYIFHNLLTKQGRINELTLPATNLERFLWHVVVIVIGVQVVWLVGILCSDLLHALFRLAIPHAEIKSITKVFLDYSALSDITPFGHHSFGIILFFFIMFCCYVRSFCLGNAWKYKYNIPWTFLFYFVFQNAFGLLLLFLIKLFISREFAQSIAEWISGTNPTVWIVCLNIFAVLLYVGIWCLTYRLYCRAQITTRRNP